MTDDEVGIGGSLPFMALAPSQLFRFKRELTSRLQEGHCNLLRGDEGESCNKIGDRE